MTRKVVYGSSLWIFLIAIAMTISSIILPDWISWDTDTPYSKPIHYSYGLHTRCSSVTGTCDPFPPAHECRPGSKSSFCTLWRTTSFLMSVSVVFELTTLICFAVLLIGGKQRRTNGWKILVVLLGLCAAVQIAATAIVTWCFEEDQRFIPGWKLDRSFGLAVGSWVVQMGIAVGVVVAKFTMAEEGGYELIPDRTA